MILCEFLGGCAVLERCSCKIQVVFELKYRETIWAGGLVSLSFFL